MNKNSLIAKKNTEGDTIYWQGGPWWGKFEGDAQAFTEEEARQHERGFNSAGVHKVFVVERQVEV